ncbi:MAG: hypothetical protein NT028_09405 [candidate division Zixibacteria bacterium]|nr:hypothetical protein [candidate division Zixibacteria bacterium]
MRRTVKSKVYPLMVSLLLVALLIATGGCSKDKTTTPAVNHPPVVASVTVSPSSVAYGGSATVTVSATDQDGDALTYTYTVTGGSIAPAGASATWTLPSSAGNFVVNVSVSDGKATAQGTGGCMVVQPTDSLVIWEDWESGSINATKWTQHGAGAHISNDGYQSSHSVYFGSSNWGDVKSNISYSFSDIKPKLDFWARTNGSSDANNLGISLEGPTGTSQTYLGIYIRPEASLRKIECSAGSQNTIVPYPLSEDNTWHHYNIVVNDDGTASFYKDGSIFWQSSPVTWASLTTWQLRLSGYNYGANIPVLDNVALYNRSGAK